MFAGVFSARTKLSILPEKNPSMGIETLSADKPAASTCTMNSIHAAVVVAGGSGIRVKLSQDAPRPSKMLSRAVTTRPIHILRPRLLSTSTPLNASVDSLVGTAPTHNAYIFLHSQHRPKDFPAALPSPLRSALQLRAREWRGLVNFAWNPAYSNPYDFTHRTATGGGEVCSATAFVAGRHSNSRLDIPSVSLDNVDSVAEQVKQHLVASHSSLEVDPPRPVFEGQDRTQADDTVYLYVCTHGAKDCRCGDWGGQVADALRTEVWKRGLEDAGLGKRVVVSEVGHVGGHK